MATLTNIEQVIVELYKNLLTEREDDFYGRLVNIASVTKAWKLKQQDVNVVLLYFQQ